MGVDQQTKGFFRYWRIILAELFLLMIAIGALIHLNTDKDTVSIAVVAPLTGEQQETGYNVKNTLELYAERINKYGGIQGKTLEVKFYDDQGDADIARQKAQEIISENKAVAVLGHFANETTEGVAKLYREANIPLIVPTSNLKERHDLLFQISPAPESSGEYMAHYVRDVLKKDLVTILHSTSPNSTHNQDLVAAFTQSFTQLGGSVNNVQTLSNDPATLKTEISTIVDEFEQLNEYGHTTSVQTNLETDNGSNKTEAPPKSDNNNHMLLLVTEEQQTIPLIVALKRNNIELPIMTTDGDIGEKFNAYPEEKKHAGYFSDGIYVPEIMILDSVYKSSLALVRKDYELRYEGKIDRAAKNALLAALFVRNTLVEGEKTNDINAMREKVKTMGNIDWFFDDTQKALGSALYIGVFENQHLITAPLNPLAVNFGDVIETRNNHNKLLKFKDINLYPTHFVYSGISMNSISDINIDMTDFTYTLDFFVWFRYKDNIPFQVNDIQFLNTVKPTKLQDVLTDKGEIGVLDEGDTNAKKKIISNDVKAALIRTSSFDGENYELYRVKGRFKTMNPKNYATGQQNLYVRFRHSDVNLYKLSYAVDFMNTNEGVFNLELNEKTTHLIKDESLALNYNFSYTDISSKTGLGDPEIVSESNQFREFIAEYRIESAFWSFRGIASWVNQQVSGREDQIDMGLMIFLLSLSCAVFLFTLYGQRSDIFVNTSTLWWIVQLFVIFFILLFGELVLSQAIYNLKYSDWGQTSREAIETLMFYMEYTIAILWWLIPAYYITSAFDQFLWQPISRKTGAKVPKVLRLFIITIIYALAGLGIMAFVLEVTLAGLAATSGVIALLFAIASKIDLSNIMAGLEISVSKVFKLGDWVKINDVEGKVVEMTPRTTKVLTFNSSVINIPNTVVSSAVIENFTRPDPTYRLKIHLETVATYRFERVEKILLDAVYATDGILDTPAPHVSFKGQGDSCQIYEVVFYIDDYAKHNGLWQATWRRIWRHLEQAEIELATPQREVFLPKAESKDMSAPLTILDSCDVFANLSEDVKQKLTECVESRHYNKGEVILRQEDKNDKLFIIIEGAVGFNQKSENGDTVEIKRLGAAEVFGQLSLLNLQDTQATIIAKKETEVFIITEKDFIAFTQNT